MSALLERALDPQRRAEAEAADAQHAFGHGPSGAGYGPRGGYFWPQVKPRTAPERRRTAPDPARFNDGDAS